MSVHYKVRRGVVVAKPVAPKMVATVSAASILSTEHPLHENFMRWLGGNQPTKRQARAYLNQYPQLRAMRAAA